MINLSNFIVETVSYKLVTYLLESRSFVFNPFSAFFTTSCSHFIGHADIVERIRKFDALRCAGQTKAHRFKLHQQLIGEQLKVK